MQRTQTICLVILATIATGFSLYYLKTVLLPFVIALFIVIGCRPVLTFLEKRLKLNRYVAFLVAFATGTAILVAFALTIWLSINDLTRHSDRYEERLNAIASWATSYLNETGVADTPDELTDQEFQPGNMPDRDENGNQGADSEEGDGAGGDGERVITAAAEDAKQAISEFTDFAVQFMKSQVFQVAGSLSNLLSYGVLILIFVFFLMLGQGAKPVNQPTIVREIETQVRNYLVMKTVISALTGFAFGLVLWLFGVPLATLFGFLAFLLNFIPNIGPMIAMLLPVPFLVLNSQMAPSAAVFCFILAALIQFISGNVIETRIMGKSFDVSPVVLLLALMFFGLVWGIIGMFLATPIVSIIKITLQQNPSTTAISELMAGRWVN